MIEKILFKIFQFFLIIFPLIIAPLIVEFLKKIFSCKKTKIEILNFNIDKYIWDKKNRMEVICKENDKDVFNKLHSIKINFKLRIYNPNHWNVSISNFSLVCFTQNKNRIKAEIIDKTNSKISPIGAFIWKKLSILNIPSKETTEIECMCNLHQKEFKNEGINFNKFKIEYKIDNNKLQTKKIKL